MPRATNAVATKKRRARVLNTTKGYFGKKSKLFRYAKDAMWRAGQFAYRDRRKKKTDFRNLWIVRINAACREQGIAYSRFMAGLKAMSIELDRKALSELAIHDPVAFKSLVEQAKQAVQAKATA